MATIETIKLVLGSVADILIANKQPLTDLDQEIGDGDMGITMVKIAEVLRGPEVQGSTEPDIGKFLMATGMAANRAAASTMGTLMATALMRAGKEISGQKSLSDEDTAKILLVAVQSIQDRGKAKLDDKTIVDALHPAAESFASAIGNGVPAALAAAAQAAAQGRDRVTPLRSKIGRAGWVGERTEGKVDAGCEMAVLVLTGLNSASV